MIHHVFNSSLVSGPELLVLPNLAQFPEPFAIILLQERRLPEGAARVADFAIGLGHTVHEFPVAGRLDYEAARAMRAFWRETRPTVVHAHGPKAALHVLLALSRMRDRPLFLTTHHGVRANDQSAKLRLFETIYEKLVMPRTDLCLTVCTSDRELLISRGVPAEKLAVHLNGISRRPFSGSARRAASAGIRRAWSDELGVGLSNAFIVGVVGRLAPEKQHDLILRAFARFREGDSAGDRHLLCFGSGPREAGLVKQTADLGLQGSVHWMGYRPDVYGQMPGLDVLLSVSSAEGLPINLLEAGWSGVPVIASGVDGVRDLIHHGDSGLLLDSPAEVDAIVEAIERMRVDRAVADRMADRLQATVAERFSRESWIRRLSEIYAGLRPRA